MSVRSPSILGSPVALGAAWRVLVDGHPGDAIGILDRGLHYGDGLFETIRVRAGRPCQWRRHLERLNWGAGRLGIPLVDSDRLADESLAISQGLDDGVLKIILTRGSGGRGYRPPLAPAPRRILILYPLPQDPGATFESGVLVRYCRTPASLNPDLAGIKHLNRLDSVLARREWGDPRIAEGLMLDPSGRLVGGTMSNLFLWDGERLLTPGVEGAGIAGTTRGLMIETARHRGVVCVETNIEPPDLKRAEGLFLTNAVAGVWPVRQLEDHAFDLGRLPWDLLAAVRQAARTSG